MGIRYCHVCDGDTLSGASVDRSGTIDVCSACGTPYPKGASVTHIATAPTEARVDVQYSLPNVPGATPLQPSKSKASAVVVASAKSRDALRDIRARRRLIKSEIKNLRGLEAEDRELAAAEHAIEVARRASVTPIRSTK